MANRLFERLFPRTRKHPSYLHAVTGSFYKLSSVESDTSKEDIQTQIDTMRALARDSQISTALSYYATDATVTNSVGNIIWATPIDKNSENIADIINELFKRLDINSYARDHILELATVGNLYIPTTDLYREYGTDFTRKVNVALDNNTIVDDHYDIIPSTKIDPGTVLHLYRHGKPFGYIVDIEDTTNYIIYPDSSIIHFSLGGLLGDYTIDLSDNSGNTETYDIKFAQPLMEKAVQPTQTLGLLEDSLLLSSLTRVVRFVNIECGNLDESEIRQKLIDIKDIIESQFSLNTQSGDAQSYLNPQSPNNLIFLPMINGTEAISITDLNMSDATDADNYLLNHYQDKKLSVLGVPKEAMNFSSNEGLGGAGSVLSQRSALYANSLERLETAYKNGWKDALNNYFTRRGLSGFVDKFVLNMQPIITPLSTVISEKRDSAVGQAQQVIDLLKNLGVTDESVYRAALSEIMKEEFPEISSQADSLTFDLSSEGGADEF